MTWRFLASSAIFNGEEDDTGAAGAALGLSAASSRTAAAPAALLADAEESDVSPHIHVWKEACVLKF